MKMSQHNRPMFVCIQESSRKILKYFFKEQRSLFVGADKKKAFIRINFFNENNVQVYCLDHNIVIIHF